MEYGFGLQVPLPHPWLCSFAAVVMVDVDQFELMKSMHAGRLAGWRDRHIRGYDGFVAWARMGGCAGAEHRQARPQRRASLNSWADSSPPPAAGAGRSNASTTVVAFGSADQ